MYIHTCILVYTLIQAISLWKLSKSSSANPYTYKITEYFQYEQYHKKSKLS